MRAVSLLYHDVVDPGDFAASGFPGDAADSYKLPAALFAEHVEAIAATVDSAPLTARDLRSGVPGRTPWLLTFDDGGRSAYTHIADALERRGWRGHFFMTSGYLDAPAFLTRSQLVELHRRGHVIGSHSATHPMRMSACTWDQLLSEWTTSVATLSDVLGEQVTVASVPGGYYSAEVGRAAAAAGIRALFNSEPTTHLHREGECLIIGRFGFRTASSASSAARLARGDLAPRFAQALLWNAKRIAKRANADLYLRGRRALLGN